MDALYIVSGNNIINKIICRQIKRVNFSAFNALEGL